MSKTLQGHHTKLERKANASEATALRRYTDYYYYYYYYENDRIADSQ